MFEPSAGNRIFSEMAAAEHNLWVIRNTEVARVKRSGDEWIIRLKTSGGTLKYSAAVLIDATELGDVAAMCGVKYDIGMDSRHDTGEDIAPERANNIIQDLTYVAVLKDYGREVPMARPEGYDPSLFACSCINPLCSGPDSTGARWSCSMMLNYGKLQNNKYMINWPLSGNDYYVNLIEMDQEERTEALKEAKQKTLCFLWFIRNELGYKNLALAGDEFPTADSLPFIPYHRESRRIHGKVRFTLNHIKALLTSLTNCTALALPLAITRLITIIQPMRDPIHCLISVSTRSPHSACRLAPLSLKTLKGLLLRKNPYR